MVGCFVKSVFTNRFKIIVGLFSLPEFGLKRFSRILKTSRVILSLS
jgi:hypothetical protein